MDSRTLHRVVNSSHLSQESMLGSKGEPHSCDIRQTCLSSNKDRLYIKQLSEQT